MSDRADGARGPRHLDVPTTVPSRAGARPAGPLQRSRANAPHGPRLTGPPPRPRPRGLRLRVVLVSRDKMLAGALRSLIDTPGGVRMLDCNSVIDSAIWHADVVIVDMPPTLHQRIFDVIDGRFLGRAVVLLEEGERAEAVPGGPPARSSTAPPDRRAVVGGDRFGMGGGRGIGGGARRRRGGEPGR